MASINQVTIELQVRGERTATEALRDFAEANKRVGSSVGEVARKVSSIEGEWKSLSSANRRNVIDAKELEAAQTKLAQQLALLTNRSEDEARTILASAETKRRAAQAAEELARAQRQQSIESERAARLQAQVAAETEALARAYNPLMAATLAYERRIEELNRAKELGVMGADRLQAELVQLSAAYGSIGSDTSRAAGFINNFGSANGFASRQLNGMGMGIQQVGYQVGDFLVQVQSGTNFLVAFGQQATQLVGILPMMGAGFMGLSMRSLIGLSAGLGIAIPLLTAFGALLMRSGGQAETAADRINQLESAVQSYQGAVETLNSSQEELEERFGRFAAVAGLVAQELETRALQEITSEIRAFTESLGVLSGSRGVANLRDLLGLSSMSSSGRSEAMQSFASAVQQLAQAESVTDQVSAAENLLQVFDSVVGSQGRITEGNQRFRNDLVDLISTLIQLGGTLDQQDEGRLAMARQITEEENRRNQQHAQRIQDVQGEIRVSQLMLQYGRDSVEVQTELNRQARARVVTEMMAAGHTAESIAAYIALVRQAQELEQAVDAAADSADELTENLGGAASADFTSLNAQVQFLARTLGIAAQEAAALDASLPGGTPQVQPPGLSFGLGSVDTQRFGDFGGETLGFGRLPTNRRFVDRTGAVDVPLPDTGGSTGSGAGATEDAFASRIPAIREMQAAIEAARIEAQLFDQEVSLLDDALENGLITQQQYNELLQESQKAYGQASQAAYDYDAAMEQVSNTAKSAMEDAFMSIIDGSASASDAFKGMARAIIAEAMRMLVIRPLINGLFGMFGFSNGGAFSGGKVLPFANGGAFSGGNVIPFANGGVVSSPTMFPMRGNQTGLMGEAGPEAIMPLKRTRGGKLGVVAEGGGDTVNVYQTINISTGVQQTVRNEIRQMMPQIAESAKSAVVDAKRRGGGYGRAFQ